MGIVDKKTVATPAAVALAPVHEYANGSLTHALRSPLGREQIPLPEPEVHVVQPSPTLARRMLVYLQTCFGGGAIPPGDQADVDPHDLRLHMTVPHPGSNQAVMQAAEPIPRPPPEVGFSRRARIWLTIVTALLIAVSIRPDSAAAAAAGTRDVDNALGMGVERVVGVDVKTVDPPVVQIAVTLPAESESESKPMATGRPVIN